MNSKTTFVTVNPKYNISRYIFPKIQKQPLLLLIIGKNKLGRPLKKNSKTTFVTVNLPRVTTEDEKKKKFKNNLCYC